MVQGIGQRHFAVRVMVAVGLAIGSDVHQLGPGAGLLGKGPQQPLRKLFAVIQQALKGHGPRNGSVVEEEIDGSPRGQSQTVNHGGINELVADVLPDRVLPIFRTPLGLIGGEDR